jgi:hypothetical protein
MCTKQNLQHTWQGKLDILDCVLDEEHEGNHKGIAKKIGQIITNPAEWDGWEIVLIEGVHYLVEHEVVYWDDASCEPLQ